MAVASSALSAAPLSYRRSRALVLHPLPPAAVAVPVRTGRRGHGGGDGRSPAPALSLTLALLLLLTAALVAPEGAADQAAICQRHNGVEACRVW